MKKVKDIVIVGGGSSGWLAAAYLSWNFKNLNITIIDKEIGTPVGVGEATVLNFAPFLSSCGFLKEEWFPEMDATEKLGIEFVNWIDKNKHVYHPFFNDQNTCTDYKEAMLTRFNDLSNVAYHVNCGKLVLFIQKKLKGKVKFKKIDVSKVVHNDSGVEHLILKNKEKIKADLYIDCTGFNSILKDKTEKIMLRDRLICDTAVAGQIQYKNLKKEKVPYTRCEAVDEGWIWSIPVASRIGSGFIFNRQITDIEDAKDFFVKHWDNRIKKEDLKTIDWTPYYDKKIWNKNVVSVGLSAGFIEPLESTGLMLAMEGVYSLCKRIYKYSFNENDQNYYNQHMKMFYENSIDFVSMHYLVSKRKGIFWEKGRQLKPSGRFNLFKKDTLNKNYNELNETGLFNDTDCFVSSSWFCWLKQTL
jgi:tryptophan halogenase|tara:strand:- start:370 stop:1617 length:1248 start_codon:yes stop_codon:yes gene_type:complete